MSHHLFTSPLIKVPTPNFEEFLKRTIERMSPSTLINSYGKGKGLDAHLLERTWQMVWYRTATTVAPKDTSVSPDVGATFSANGFLDFFVNSDYCWGIELTREGNRLKEHAERFVNGGKYDKIPMKNWAIIDFRCYQKEVKELKTNFWYVLYANDYKSVTIKRSGQQDEVLFLKGDKV
ncbi:7085_t:CDS:1 [Funneliformis caledonium]|uniref:7085_t:CDS:1 n=1 Tax=Funneliformis caledonium TaxID=1117310 RepID=A0A9N9E719_9GLOM|nr:7085_t:CDS:1 [Funneliformis caledonium]